MGQAVYEGPFRCERCGRKAGAEMVACPERAAGSCPYQVEDVSVSRWSCGLVTAAVVALTVGAALLTQRVTDPFFGMLLFGAAVGLALVSVVGVLNLFASPATVLINRETGASWARVTLAGRTYSTQVTTPAEPVSLGLVLGRPLEFPASLALVRSDLRGMPRDDVRDHAIEIVEMTLVALMAQGLISVRRAHRYESFFGRPLMLDSVKYLLVPGPRAGKVALESELEQRVMRVLFQAHLARLDSHTPVRVITVSWQFPPRVGIEVRPLVFDIFDRPELDPYCWLIEKVHADAVAQDVLQRTPSDWRRGRTAYDTTGDHSRRLHREREALRALRDDLMQTHPAFVAELHAQIERALLDRHDD